jgi:hypothetical protein
MAWRFWFPADPTVIHGLLWSSVTPDPLLVVTDNFAPLLETCVRIQIWRTRRHRKGPPWSRTPEPHRHA